MVFSAVNRLHLTYERNGDIFYRVADFGAHPADSPEEYVVQGANPTVLLDPYNYALIVYEAESLAEAEAMLADDPFSKEGIIKAAKINEWNRVLP